MAGKFSSLLAVCALLSNSQSNNLVTATFNTVSNGVVRIELEKKYVNYFDNVQLEDMTDIDLMIDSPIGVVLPYFHYPVAFVFTRPLQTSPQRELCAVWQKVSRPEW